MSKPTNVQFHASVTSRHVNETNLLERLNQQQVILRPRWPTRCEARWHGVGVQEPVHDGSVGCGD